MSTVMPSLDHYFGRKVVSAEPTDDGWKIVLEGDVTIEHSDPELPLPVNPESLKGQSLQRAVYADPYTSLYFGDIEVTMDGNRWSILDPALGEEPVFPQRNEFQQELPPLPEARTDSIATEPPEVSVEGTEEAPESPVEPTEDEEPVDGTP